MRPFAPVRKVLWLIFERVRGALQSRQLTTYAELFTSLAAAISKSKKVVFDFAVVDEAQDISVAHIRFFAALGNGRANALFFAGDLGQRIFQQPILVEGPRRRIRVGRAPCALIIELPIRYALRRTGYSVPLSPT